jgi:trk system potassium uptake protein TrkA
MEKRNEFVVIGCGRFGISCALCLADWHQEVMVVDIDEDVINELSDKVTRAVVADVTQEGILRDLGVQNFDTAVVSIGSNFQASIVATIACKDLGVKTVIAKARDRFHGRILEKVGADRVVIPEEEMGIKLATGLVNKNIVDFIELSQEHSIAEIRVPKSWTGRTIDEIDVRSTYGISIVALLRGNEVIVNPRPSQVLQSTDTMVAVGDNEDVFLVQQLDNES